LAITAPGRALFRLHGEASFVVELCVRLEDGTLSAHPKPGSGVRDPRILVVSRLGAAVTVHQRDERFPVACEPGETTNFASDAPLGRVPLAPAADDGRRGAVPCHAALAACKIGGLWVEARASANGDWLVTVGNESALREDGTFRVSLRCQRFDLGVFGDTLRELCAIVHGRVFFAFARAPDGDAIEATVGSFRVADLDLGAVLLTLLCKAPSSAHAIEMRAVANRGSPLGASFKSIALSADRVLAMANMSFIAGIAHCVRSLWSTAVPGDGPLSPVDCGNLEILPASAVFTFSGSAKRGVRFPEPDRLPVSALRFLPDVSKATVNVGELRLSHLRGDVSQILDAVARCYYRSVANQIWRTAGYGEGVFNVSATEHTVPTALGAVAWVLSHRTTSGSGRSATSSMRARAQQRRSPGTCRCSRRARRGGATTHPGMA